MKALSYVLVLLLGVGGGTVGRSLSGGPTESDVPAGASQPTAPAPAYMIISVNELHPEKMGPYRQAVRPVVQEKAGGATLLGLAQRDDIEVLEGQWDFPGILLIERFKSMDALKNYWYSDDHQNVKKLRDGLAEANFFVAIEGKPGS